MTSEHNSLGPAPQYQTILEQEQQCHEPSSSTNVQENVPTAETTQTTSMIELEILLSIMFDEYINGGDKGVSNSSVVSDNSQRDTSPQMNVVYPVRWEFR
ncbi:hypothetical protein Tco_1581606, partial [Tanacetum coccineum]